MNTSLSSLLAASLLLGVLACGNTQDVKDPSKTDSTAATEPKAAEATAKPATTIAVPATGDAKLATAEPTKPAMADAKPATDLKPAMTDTKPVDAATDAKCKDAPKPTAKDAKGCLAECAKLDAKAPAGSRCIPPRTSCEQQCKTVGK